MRKFKLETSALNYHLKRLAPLLDRDAAGRYRLNDRGFAAYRVAKFARSELAKPSWPVIRKERVPVLAKTALLGMYKLTVNPLQAFREAQREVTAYGIYSAIILTLPIPITSIDFLTRTYLGLFLGIILCLSLVKIAYKKRPSLVRLSVSFSLAQLPIMVHPYVVTQAFIRNYVIGPSFSLSSILLGLFLSWAFFLLILAIEETCQTSARAATILALILFSVGNLLKLL